MRSPESRGESRTGHPWAAHLTARHFGPSGGELTIGGIRASELVAEFGSPVFVYDAEIVRDHFASLRAALPETTDLFYSVKANPHPEIIRLAVDLGAGAEVASGAEILTARAAGCAAERILFAGPAKSRAELELAVREGVGRIHVESIDEVDHLDAITREIGGDTGSGRLACAVRINPRTSSGGSGLQMGGAASAFGFDEEQVDEALRRIARAPGLVVDGIHVYVGTQILDSAVLLTQWRAIVELAARIARVHADLLGGDLAFVGLGGGLGVPYFPHDEELDLTALRVGAIPILEPRGPLCGARFGLEPGRFLVASAGVYLARVQSVKSSHDTRFVILDGGMHHHLAASGNLGRIVRRNFPIVNASRAEALPTRDYEVAGPLCTPLDTLGRRVELPETRVGDLLAILQSGAYGLTASPWAFLSRPTPAEVLVDGGAARLIRAAGTLHQPIGSTT